MDLLNWFLNNAASMGLLAAWIANAVVKYSPLFGKNVSAVHAFVKASIKVSQLVTAVLTKIDAAMSGTVPPTPPTIPGI